MEQIEARDLQTKSETGLKGQLGLDDEAPKVEKTETPQDPPPPTPESMLQGGKFSPATSRQTVDGQDYDVSPDEIAAAGGERTWRIQKAAENRLEQAKEALAEIQRLKSTAETPKQAPDDFVKQKLEVMKWGTPEESAKAFQELMDARQAKPIDQNEMVNQVADRIRHDDAVRQFDKEFSDIAVSQDYLDLVMTKRNRRLAKGHPGDWNNFYRSIGNEVRAIMPKQSQQAGSQKSPDTPSQLTEKEERKSSIVNLPQASARAAVAEEPKPETRADVLNAMRKKRGLPIG
jgi:hypothetical protein